MTIHRPAPHTPRWRRASLTAAAAVLLAGLVPAGAVAADVRGGAELRPGAEQAARAAAERPPSPQPREREAAPADRYAPAGRCYVIASAGAPVGTDGDALVVDRDLEPLALRFEPTRLGHYLLYTPDGGFVGAPEGPLADLLDAVGGSSPGAMLSGVTSSWLERALGVVGASALGEATGRLSGVTVETTPGPLTDWELTEHDGSFQLRLVDDGPALTVIDDHLDLAPADVDDPAQRFTLELVPGCAEFPDIDPGVSGEVVGGDQPWGPVGGYSDPHVHLMAFEFLGGRARCGRPWHPYGVEAAMAGCPEHEQFGGRTHVLETFLSGRDPLTGHDTTGWPTFAEWPQHDSLTLRE